MCVFIGFSTDASARVPVEWRVASYLACTTLLANAHTQKGEVLSLMPPPFVSSIIITVVVVVVVVVPA